MEERAAAEAEALEPVDDGTETETKPDVKRQYKKKGDLKPLMNDGSAVVAPMAHDDDSVEPLAPLEASPLTECRKLIAPSAESGAPVALINAEAATANDRWKVYLPANDHPVFVSSKRCPGKNCMIRLLFSSDGYLTAIDAPTEQLQLRSFWNKVKGTVSSGFASVESGVADIKKTIGITVNIDDFPGKRLYIESANRSVNFYLAVREQGPEVLAATNGTLKDGAVYLPAGATAVKQGADYALKGTKYVVQYIQNNTCYLIRLSHLTFMFGDFALHYEAGFHSGATDYYNKYAGPTSYKAQLKKQDSPKHVQVMLGIKAYALWSSLSTGALNGGRLNLKEWEDLITDIVVGAFDNRIKGAYVPYIFSKVAKAQCKGTKEAISSAHALIDAATSSGIPDDCLAGLQDRANRRFEQNGEDICFALRDEINSAAAASPSSSVWAPNACPNDSNADAYNILLEGVGCVVGQGADPKIEPETVLDRNRWWGRTHDWHAVMECPNGQIVTGFCASGAHEDCYGHTKEILCAGRADTGLTEYPVNDFGRDWRGDMGYCPTDSVLTSFCSSGYNMDCNRMGMWMRCSRLKPKFAIDYNHREIKESKTWTGRIDSTRPNHAIVGLCTSGGNPDCGDNSDVTKSAMFCPIVLRANKPATHAIHRLVAKNASRANLMITNLYANPWNHYYRGVAFNLYDDNSTGNRIPLYNCLSGPMRFNSLDSKCEGQKNEGFIGYMNPSGDKPIYRCTLQQGQSLTTTEPETCHPAFGKGIIGYAAP